MKRCFVCNNSCAFCFCSKECRNISTYIVITRDGKRLTKKGVAFGVKERMSPILLNRLQGIFYLDEEHEEKITKCLMCKTKLDKYKEKYCSELCDTLHNKYCYYVGNKAYINENGVRYQIKYLKDLGINSRVLRGK